MDYVTIGTCPQGGQPEDPSGPFNEELVTAFARMMASADLDPIDPVGMSYDLKPMFRAVSHVYKQIHAGKLQYDELGGPSWEPEDFGRLLGALMAQFTVAEARGHAVAVVELV